MKPIKLSAPDWCFYPKLGNPARYYDTLKEIGMDGVEMLDPSRYAAARSAGLEIVTMSGPGMTKGLNRLEHHAELIPQIRDAIQHAGQNHIPILIVFSGNRAGQEDKDGINNCRRGFDALLPDAEQAGVVLGFEMLNGSDHPDYQADRGQFGFELAEEIGSPWFKLVYDIYHMERMGDDSVYDIVNHLPAIAHLHVAESPNRSAPLGDGNIRHSQIIPAVLKAGYQGYWGLEYIPGKGEGNQQEPLVELTQAVALFRLLAGSRR
jgi:hydroxypyruvate isomerase